MPNVTVSLKMETERSF